MDTATTNSPTMTTMETRPADTPVTRPAGSRDVELPPLDPDTRPDAIPPAIWNRLVMWRDRLEREGAVVSDSESGRCPRYRLRFRCRQSRVDSAGYHTSRQRQLSVELGTEETARTVERLLAAWRDDDVRMARMQRLYAASKAEAERDERRRLEAERDASHDEAIAEDEDRSRQPAPAPDDNRDEVESRSAAPVPQLPPALVAVPCYRPLSWREAKTFFIDCVEAPPDPDEERHELNVRAFAEHHAQVAEANIPNELLDKLLSLKSALVEHGVILKRGEPDRRPSYRLRARASHPDYARTHRAIPIPDDVVDMVELLLAAWRAPKRAAERRRRNTERRLVYARRAIRRLLTELYATSQDRPEVIAEAIGIASVLKCLVRGAAPFRLVPA